MLPCINRARSQSPCFQSRGCIACECQDIGFRARSPSGCHPIARLDVLNGERVGGLRLQSQTPVLCACISIVALNVFADLSVPIRCSTLWNSLFLYAHRQSTSAKPPFNPAIAGVGPRKSRVAVLQNSLLFPVFMDGHTPAAARSPAPDHRGITPPKGTVSHGGACPSASPCRSWPPVYARCQP